MPKTLKQFKPFLKQKGLKYTYSKKDHIEFYTLEKCMGKRSHECYIGIFDKGEHHLLLASCGNDHFLEVARWLTDLINSSDLIKDLPIIVSTPYHKKTFITQEGITEMSKILTNDIRFLAEITQDEVKLLDKLGENDG